MMPGYLCALFLFMICILLTTGWKPILAPNLRIRWMLLLMGLTIVALMRPIWLAPLVKYPGFTIHGAVCLLLVSSAIAGMFSVKQGHFFYLMLCSLMLAVVWGSTRTLYVHESVLYWLSPSLDAPLLAGFLCGVFTSDSNQQLGITIWGAAAGECMATMLQEGAFQGQIGSWTWWDGLAIAICTAFSLTAIVRVLRGMISKLGAVWLQQRGGRSS